MPKKPASEDLESGIHSKSKAESNDLYHRHQQPRKSMDDSMFAVGAIDAQYGSTQRGLKSRHAQMIALGGSIGTAYDRTPFSNLMHM